jgi:hypothetical protein
MSTKKREIINSIQKYIDDKVQPLSDEEYCEVLEEIASYAEAGAEAKRAELA